MLALLAVHAKPLFSQEITARVTLNKSQITNASLDYLDDLVPLIESYINTNKWTEHEYLEHERIRMNIQIVLNAESNNNFDASLIITTERPIYNTLQLTPITIISDNAWRFNYARNRTITRDLFQFDDIASILDFYTYFILGMDYDTFSDLGGTPFFRQAQNILDIAQSTGAPGWTSGTGTRRNRYYLITGIVSPSHEGLRKSSYRYHRHGLDTFTRNPESSRRNIFEALQGIQESKRQTTDDYLFDLFFGAKFREITAIFLDAESAQRLEAYILLSQLDSSRLTEYERLQ
jgi:hypothetical protein